MLQTILKEATKTYHHQLEQLMYVDEIMNNTLTLPQYKQLLTINYLVNEEWENFLFTSLSTSLAAKLHIEKRSKRNALLADMEELKIAIPKKITTHQQLGISKNDAAILGALYVLEGATLGGNIIYKKLATNAALTHLDLHFHYYQVYGNNLITYWKEFCEVLNQQPPETDAISVQAAQQMFASIILLQQQTANSVA